MMAVTKRFVAALAALTLLPLGACSGDATTTTEVSYQVTEPVTALVVAARAASVDITVGDGPISVTEVHRYSSGKPSTAHQVDGSALRLTESGCGDDNARCDVEFRIRMPKATSAEIDAKAGAVKVNGLGGDIRVTTEAGAVEAKALSSDQVTVQTSAGAASLEFTEPPAMIKVTSDVGAVTVRVPAGESYAIAAEAKTGSTEVSVPNDPASAHRIEVSTDLGAIRIESLP